MEKREAWIKLVEEKSAHYLNLGDGGFDEKMRVHLVRCDYEAQSVTYAFETQKWQINEKGGIHGGAILGMFDSAFGVVANFTAGPNEATTTDMAVSFIRGVEYGMNLELTVYIVKAGRSLIRQGGVGVAAPRGTRGALPGGRWMPVKNWETLRAGGHPPPGAFRGEAAAP